MAEITSITEKQRGLVSKLAQETISDALRVRPIDKTASEAAVKRMYELAKLEPRKVEWVSSPVAGAFMATDRALDIEAKKTGVRGKRFWHYCFNGSWWSGFAAFGVAMRDILGVDLGPAGSDFKIIYENGLDPLGFYWLNRDFALASERPIVTKLDVAGRLHDETGPAIAWSDGFAIYAWHGTVVPKEWIENRDSLEPKTALMYPNIEQRRAAAEIIGWERVLEGVGARVVDADPNPEIGVLLEADLPDAPNSRFLKVLCGTGRTFVLSVPAEMRDALEANAWTYGLGRGAYAPEVRT